MRLVDADKLLLHLNDYALIESPNDNESIGERRISTSIYNAIQNCIKAIEEQPTVTEADIRAKAIDEFTDKISLEISESIIWDMLATMNNNSSISDTSDKITDYVIHTAEQVAEQLKKEKHE